MGGLKKEYRPLPSGSGLTVLGAAVSAFAQIPEIKTIVIAVPPVEGEAAARNAMSPQLLAGKNGPAIHFVGGGATRQASVFNALFLLAEKAPPDFVLIHDGARPWVSQTLIGRIIAETKKCRAAIPLLPLTETPKETDGEWGMGSGEWGTADCASLRGVDERMSHVPAQEESAASSKVRPPLGGRECCGQGTMLIKRHLKRAFVGAAQTPQGFAFPEILAAHQQAAAQGAHIEYTDDAEVWAAFCGPVAAIPGEGENHKITFPEDL
jgi:2-C-methyl-D-erythritol 4-phosphate cytidylyltransferase